MGIMRLSQSFCLAAMLTAFVCVSASPSSGGGSSSRRYPSGRNTVGNPVRNPCDVIRCQNRGYCDTLYSHRPRCVCRPGYSGDTCQNTDNCENMRCMNGGRCLTRGTQAYCRCAPGYTGQYCDTRTDRSGNDIGNGNACSSFQCQNGGSCSTDGEGRAHCHCARGYSGQRCESRGNSQPTQTITNLRCDNACSTATCCRICLPCDTCQYQTMCLAYEIMVKSLDAECHAQGYQEALLLVTTNSPLGYTQIKCRGSGPTRDCPQGSTCVDDGRGGATCCRNRVGRPALENKQGSCPATPEPQTCGRLSCQGDIDCAGNLKCCQRCGNRCTNPNNNPNNNQNNNQNNNVIVRDPCAYYTCENGGRCTAPADAPYCECPTGYTGRRCETRQDPCQNMRCLNGGRCLTEGTQAYCQCTQGYAGQYCDTSTDPCRDFNCLNGGRCVSQRGQASCECPRDYRGPRCGIRDDPCLTLRCENGGRCVTRGDDPICQCPNGYRGPRCGIRDRVDNQTPRPPTPCQVFGCETNPVDRCGGCPSGWTCQYISTGCPTLNCSPPTYRCVSQFKK